MVDAKRYFRPRVGKLSGSARIEQRGRRTSQRTGQTDVRKCFVHAQHHPLIWALTAPLEDLKNLKGPKKHPIGFAKS